jgi:sugar phosphate isomerase/epimerase
MLTKLWRRSDIGYCSNVHPAESFAKLARVIEGPIHRVRAARGLENMAAGLWLSAQTAGTIINDADTQARFTSLLSAHAIDLVTLNGFPYGDFHSERVKENAYLPDWAESRRLQYSCDLARLLADNLSSQHAYGSISSVPLGYSPNWSADKQQTALQQICQLAGFLRQLKEETGKQIRLCFEMEPGCVLEQTHETINFFTHDLPAAAKKYQIDEVCLQNHLGLCYDVCHQAVMFEDATAALTALTNAGVTIGKIQISSALHIEHPSEAKELLAAYVEPRYLHQVRCRNEDNSLHGCMDLNEALNGALPTTSPWRIHFHVPVHADTLDSELLSTTQEDIGAVFDFLAVHPEVRPHLEVETYTWRLLPGAFQINDDESLINGIHRELNWVEEQLTKRNLLIES